MIRTIDFCRWHGACSSGFTWAIGVSPNMAVVWDRLVEEGMYEWLLWTAVRVFDAGTLRSLLCRFVRETPAGDGRTVWDLLTDERSRHAVEVAEAYAEGKASGAELNDAYWRAHKALMSGWTPAASAAKDTTKACIGMIARSWYVSTYVLQAACISSLRSKRRKERAAAEVAHVKMIADLGNPFRDKEEEYEA